MRESLEESALNGVSHAARAVRDRRYGLAVLWTLITIALSGVTGYLLYQIVEDYYGYPVTTTVEMEYQEDGMEFPTVAVCNHSPLQCKDIFRFSLDLPELWAATGCTTGQQIERYVTKVLTEFTGAPESELRKQVNDSTLLAYVSRAPSYSSRPMVDFWAYLYIQSEDFGRMAQSSQFLDLLRILESYLETEANVKRKFWNPRTFYEVEHKVAVRYLVKAKRVWAYRAKYAADFANIAQKEGFTDYRQNPSRIPVIVAKSYLTLYAPDSFSGDAEMRDVWFQAIANGTAVGANATGRIWNVTKGFFEFVVQNLLVPIQDVPSFVWLLGSPDNCKQGFWAMMMNVDKVLNFTSPSFQKANPLAALVVQSKDFWNQPNSEDVHFFDAIDIGSVFLRADEVMDKNKFLTLTLSNLDFLLDNLNLTPGAFVKQCTFRGKPCDLTKFQLRISTLHGFCWVFNPLVVDNDTIEDSIKTHEEGPSGGLSMMLMIEEADYIKVPAQVQTVGARIGIFPYGTLPSIDDDGIDVVPGQSTNIALREMSLTRLPSPHPSNCQEDWSQLPFKISHYEYNYKACRRFCIGHHILEKCRCIDSKTSADEIEFQNGTKVNRKKWPWCDYSSRSTNDSVCANSIRINDDETTSTSNGSTSPDYVCQCRPACTVRGYDMKYSAASFPAQGLMEKFAEAEYIHAQALRNSWELFRGSMLQVNIYFSSFDVTETAEEAQYSNILSVASDVGGAIGLLLGLCGLNLLEMVILMWDIFALRKNRAKTAAVHPDAKPGTRGAGVCGCCGAPKSAVQRIAVRPTGVAPDLHHIDEPVAVGDGVSSSGADGAATSEKRLQLLQAAQMLDREILRQQLMSARKELNSQAYDF